MPWNKRSVMEEKHRFIVHCLEPGANISELCREFGIARSTGNKWLQRYREHGFRGLEELSRRPYSSPLAASPEIICEIVKYRNNKSNRGAEKIHHHFLKKFGEQTPSIRTINRILERCGLVEKRRRKKATAMPKKANEQAVALASNDIWTADYKGHWRTRNGTRCEPLTIRDDFSRFVLDLAAFEYIRLEAAKKRFQRCFELYGMPFLIRTDNGVPFCSPTAICGLSQLSVWWIKLGIAIERIPRGKPQYNGGHERMHRDIAMDLEKHPEFDLLSQQKAFDEWCYEFNFERPHSALKNETPASVYSTSSRLYDPKEPEYEYPANFELRKVDSIGYAYWRNNKIKVSKALKGEYIAFEQVDDFEVNIWFCDLLIAKTDIKGRMPLTPIGVSLGGSAMQL